MSIFKFFDQATTQPDNKQKEMLPFEPKAGKHQYNIEVAQEMVVNGHSFVNTLTHINWDYEVKVVGTNGKEVALETTGYELKHAPETNRTLIDFALFFNKPAEKLELELEPRGTIKAVLNQLAVFEKWQKIKNTELAHFLNDEGMRGVFIAGDTEFSKTINTLLQNPLYIIFFEDIYGRPLNNISRPGRQIELSSKLFPGNLIKLNNHQSLIQEEKTLKVKNSYVSDSTVDSGMNDSYLKDYKGITGPNFNYDYKLLAFSEYDVANGTLLKAAATCTERANDNLSHQTRYNIELKS
jgi:hypothetical protein